MFCCQHCSRLSAILFSIVTPDLQASSGSTTCSVLLTTLNNVGSKTLFYAAFIRPEQIVCFWLCTLEGWLHLKRSWKLLHKNTYRTKFKQPFEHHQTITNILLHLITVNRLISHALNVLYCPVARLPAPY